MYRTIENLSRRIGTTETEKRELESKLVKTVTDHDQISAEFSQLSADFKSLEKQYIEQADLHDETGKALNAKSQRMETMSQDLATACQELKIKQDMVTKLELAAVKPQVNCYKLYVAIMRN